MDYRRKDPLDYKDILENLKDPAWYDLEDPDAPLTDDAAFALEDLMRRVEEEEQRCKELEERCKRLDEARKRANEAAAKWEGAYKLALERAEKEEIARKQRNVMVCPVCQGRGRVHTSFYGYGNCLMEDVRNDKFPYVCHCCGGKGILLVNEIKEE